MKKLFTTISIIFIIALFTLPASATETMTNEDAERLIREADDFYDYVTVAISGEQADDAHYNAGNALVTDITNVTYDELLSRAEKTFTRSASEKMISETGFLINFSNGLRYVTLVPQYIPFSIDMSEMGYEHDLDLKVTVSGDRATITFNYISIESPYPEFFVSKPTNLEAELIDGEWRISGGDYLDMMFEFGAEQKANWDGVYEYFIAPPTGDAAPMLIVIAFASAVTAAAFRRRREVR